MTQELIQFLRKQTKTNCVTGLNTKTSSARSFQELVKWNTNLLLQHIILTIFRIMSLWLTELWNTPVTVNSYLIIRDESKWRTDFIFNHQWISRLQHSFQLQRVLWPIKINGFFTLNAECAKVLYLLWLFLQGTKPALQNSLETVVHQIGRLWNASKVCWVFGILYLTIVSLNWVRLITEILEDHQQQIINVTMLLW